MTTSQTASVLSDIVDDQPIPDETLRYFRRVLLNRFHEFILGVFIDQEKRNNLTKKQLAGRIGRDSAQITRWLNTTTTNLTLETISDLLLGMGVDLDDPSATTLVELAGESATPGQPVADVELDVSKVRALFDVRPAPEESSYARNAAALAPPNIFHETQAAA